MSEEAKVCQADEASRVQLSYQSGKKKESREVKGFVGTLIYSDVYRDSSDTDESSDSLRFTGILFMHSCSAALSFVCFLRQPLQRSYPFLSSPFCQTNFKKTRAREKLSLRLERIAKHKGFGDLRVNNPFHGQLSSFALQ